MKHIRQQESSVVVDDRQPLSADWMRQFILDAGADYVICPEHSPEVAVHHKKLGGKPVTERFCYSSYTNDKWLDAGALKAMLAE